MHAIEINNQGTRSLSPQRIRQLVELVLRDAGFIESEVSIAIVNDASIWELNRQYLDHDYATDVLSFRLDDATDAQQIEGEIVVSADTAERNAQQYGWTTDDELLLYVLHGALHLVGHDDANESQRRRMREEEVRYLALLDQRLGAMHAQSDRIAGGFNEPHD
jgi:probable rRNA maturation factor